MDSLKERSKIIVERGAMPESLAFNEGKAEDPDAYPIEITPRRLSEDEATPPPSSGVANGSVVSHEVFRSNMAPDATEELLNAVKANGRVGTCETVRAKYDRL